MGINFHQLDKDAQQTLAEESAVAELERRYLSWCARRGVKPSQGAQSVRQARITRRQLPG